MKFKIHDRVRHVLYGNGTIVAIKTGSYWPYVIDFDRGVRENFSDYFLTLIKKK
jgi:hypothetical protein